MINIQNLLLWGSLSFLLLSILFILIDIFKRTRFQERSVIIALRDFNFNLIQSIFYFTAFIIIFRIFLIWYLRAYSILIPDYLNKWYQIFDYNSLQIIKDIFFQNNRLLELHVITTFMNLKLDGLSMSIVLLTMGISQLYKGLQRKTISNEGVYCLYKVINWIEIVEYEWQYPIRKNNIKQNIKYYKLSLNVKNSKFIRWLLYQDTVIYTLKISTHDKDKVDCLINRNNIKLRNDNNVKEN